MNVFVVFGDLRIFPGLTSSAGHREILYVVDSLEKAQRLVDNTSQQTRYEYVGFEVLELE